MKAMIIPGNQDAKLSQQWYPWVKRGLEKLGFGVTAENMPDPWYARRNIWVPFIEQKLQGDEKSVLIGHSSGVVATLRYLEEHKAEGAVLVGPYYTDLNDELEKKSGYFDDEWHWDKIKQNIRWVIIF